MSRGVCVLGMLRTGTSATAGILEALGVSFGAPERLLAPNRANPGGFREHTGVIALNDELLARRGGTWYAPPELAPGWDRGCDLDDLRARARSLVREELEPAGRWGWKDPRTCLTLPFWQALVPGLAYVVCVREPVETARSLAAMPWVRRRVEDPLARGLDLWLRYTADALAHTEGLPRAVVRYDRMLADPDEALRRLARLAGVPERARDERVVRAVGALVRPELRHQVAGDAADVDHPARELFASLAGVADPDGGGRLKA